MRNRCKLGGRGERGKRAEDSNELGEGEEEERNGEPIHSRISQVYVLSLSISEKSLYRRFA